MVIKNSFQFQFVTSDSDNALQRELGPGPDQPSFLIDQLVEKISKQAPIEETEEISDQQFRKSIVTMSSKYHYEWNGKFHDVII